MTENKKGDSDSLSKKHFARFHERIFNKYAEMQKKLDKSRSMECLPSSVDDYDNNSLRHSICDIQELEEMYQERSDMNTVKHKIIVEDVNQQNVKVYDLEDDTVYKSEVSIVRHQSENNVFFLDDFRSSFESIYDAYKNNKASQELPNTPTRRISIRDRIETRISAVRERRREAKDKKRESREKVEKFVFTNTPTLDVPKKKNKLASVTVALIEATGSENEPIAEEKPRLVYCRVRYVYWCTVQPILQRS
uniref:Uncharacterized protein n=1 Tax=Pectinophora gossypiella TaxID=13191 RepID=A0A1E1WSA3_PECGO